MSLKIIKLRSLPGRSLIVVAAAACLVFAWLSVKWNFVNTIASRLETRTEQYKPVVDWLVQTSQGDPQAHIAAGQLYERTFDTGDLERARAEYELAAELSPYNYLRWLDVGRVRNMAGDMQGAAAAYERAFELAPNYAAAQWAYGNLLIRQGSTAEGLTLISRAAAGNADYSNPAASTALQLLDGDVGQVRTMMGDTDITNASLSSVLAAQSRFDEAADAWSRISAGARNAKYAQLGRKLAGQLIAAKRFRLALQIIADRSSIGQVQNGGFEDGVKLRDAGPFEWQITDGQQPQIGLVEGQAHSGRYSLILSFNTFETAAFRSVSQTVAIDPGTYEFEAFYRSDLRSPSSLKWDISDAASGQPLGATSVMTPTGDWTQVTGRFTVDARGDGVVIRLIREGCGGPSCPMQGKISFDDLAIRPVG